MENTLLQTAANVLTESISSSSGKPFTGNESDIFWLSDLPKNIKSFLDAVKQGKTFQTVHVSDAEKSAYGPEGRYFLFDRARRGTEAALVPMN